MLRARTNMARESKNEANAEEVMSQKSVNFVGLFCKSESISKRIKRCRGNVSARKMIWGNVCSVLRSVAKCCSVLITNSIEVLVFSCTRSRTRAFLHMR